MIAVFALALMIAPAQDAAELVRSLEDAGAAKARDIVDRIVSLGDAALLAVVEARKNPGKIDPFYLRVAEEELRFRAAMGDRLPLPPRIRLQSKDRTTLDVLTDFKVQSGIRLDMSEFDPDNPGGPVKIDIQDVPAFQALDEICRAASLYLYHDGDQFYVYSGGMVEGFSYGTADALFRLTAYRLERSRNFQDPVKETFQPEIEFLRFTPPALLEDRDEVVFVEAVDDTGKDLLLPPQEKKKEEGDPEEIYDFGMLGNGYPAVPDLRPPAPGAKTIARLRGYVPLVYAVEFEEIELTKDKSEASAAGYDVRLLSVESGDPWRRMKSLATLTPKDDKAVPPDKLKLNVMLFAPGGRILRGSATADRGKDGVLNLTSDFSGDSLAEIGEPGKAARYDKIVIRFARRTAERRVYFDFREIPWAKE